MKVQIIEMPACPLLHSCEQLTGGHHAFSFLRSAPRMMSQQADNWVPRLQSFGWATGVNDEGCAPRIRGKQFRIYQLSTCADVQQGCPPTHHPTPWKCTLNFHDSWFDDLKVSFIKDAIHPDKLGNHSNPILQPLLEQQQRRRLKKLAASGPNWWLKRIHSLEGTSSRYSKHWRTASNPAQTIVIPYCNHYWNSSKEED
jgi:hypothetical protein